MKIGAVFVLYNPDLEAVEKSVGSISSQADEVYAVDNGSCDIDSIESIFRDEGNIHLIKMQDNTGVAHALNVGINQAIAEGCDYIITCDQDSVFPFDFIRRFTELLSDYGDDTNVAAFSTSVYDAVTDKIISVIIRSGVSYKKVIQHEKFCKVACAITSGMIIKAYNFKFVGEMDERLFIDWVDCEWCFRANSKGYDIVNVRDLVFTHHLGEQCTKVLWKQTSTRTAERYYYTTRNAFFIALHVSYLPVLFRFDLFIKGVKYVIGYSLIEGQHFKNSIYSLKGMIDGMRGKMGKKTFRQAKLLNGRREHDEQN